MERSRALGNSYQVLGLHPNSSLDHVRQAYRTLAVKYHPDKNNSSDAHANFHAVSHAYHHIMSEANGLECEREATFDAFGLFKSVFGVLQFGGSTFKPVTTNGFFVIDTDPGKLGGSGNSFFFGGALGEEEEEEDAYDELGFNPQEDFDDLDADDFEEEFGNRISSELGKGVIPLGERKIKNDDYNNHHHHHRHHHHNNNNTHNSLQQAVQGGFGAPSKSMEDSTGYFCTLGLGFGSDDENEEEEEEEASYLNSNVIAGIGSFNGHGGISGFSLENMTKATTWQPTVAPTLAPTRIAPRYRPSAPTCVSCRATSIHLRWDYGQIEDARFFVLEIAEHLPTYQNNSMRVATKAALDVLADDDESTVDEDGFREIYRGDAMEFVVKGLEPATEYYFRVKAMTSDGIGGEWSDTAALSTADPPGQQAVRLQPTAETFVPAVSRPTPVVSTITPPTASGGGGKLNPSSFPFQSRLHQQESPPLQEPKIFQQSPPLPQYYTPLSAPPLPYPSQAHGTQQSSLSPQLTPVGSQPGQRTPPVNVLLQQLQSQPQVQVPGQQVHLHHPHHLHYPQAPPQVQPLSHVQISQPLLRGQSQVQHPIASTQQVHPQQHVLPHHPQEIQESHGQDTYDSQSKSQEVQDSHHGQSRAQQQAQQNQRQRKWFKVTFTPIMNGLTSELLLKIGKVMGDAVDAEVEYHPGTTIQTGRGHIWFLGVPKDLVGLGFIPVKGARWSIRWPVRSTCSACRHRGHRARECPFKALIAGNKDPSTTAQPSTAAVPLTTETVEVNENLKQEKSKHSQATKQAKQQKGQLVKNGSSPATKIETVPEHSSTTPVPVPAVSTIPTYSSSVSPEDSQSKNKSSSALSRRSRHRRGRGGLSPVSESSSPESGDLNDAPTGLLQAQSSTEGQPLGVVSREAVQIPQLPSQAVPLAQPAEVQSQGHQLTSTSPSSVSSSSSADIARSSNFTSSRSRSRAQSRVVHVWGLPWSSSEEDIATFFAGLAIDSGIDTEAGKSVWIERRADGKSTGHGYIRFRDSNEADRALERHRDFITPERYVCVEKSSEEALAAARRRSDQSTAKLLRQNSGGSSDGEHSAPSTVGSSPVEPSSLATYGGNTLPLSIVGSALSVESASHFPPTPYATSSSASQPSLSSYPFNGNVSSFGAMSSHQEVGVSTNNDHDNNHHGHGQQHAGSGGAGVGSGSHVHSNGNHNNSRRSHPRRSNKK